MSQQRGGIFENNNVSHSVENNLQKTKENTQKTELILYDVELKEEKKKSPKKISCIIL